MALMNAAVLTAPGSIALRSVAVPTLDPDQVLVRVAAVGVCGSDAHYYRHGRIGPYVVERPLVLGHEVSGRIEDVGSAVDPVRIGQRVAVEPQRPCRTCSQCTAGRYNLCPRMEFFATPPIDGAFSEFVAIQGDFAFDVPDSVSDEAAALLEPLSVGISACRRAEIGPGDRVLVAGAGPIGVIVAQTARAFGASEVIVTDLDAGRRRFALTSGATRVLDPVGETVEGLEADAFIDASGAESAVRSGIRAVRPAGRVVLVGLGNDDLRIPVSYLQDREIRLSGVFRYADTWPLAIELVRSGRVDLDSLVTARFGLAEAERALAIGGEHAHMKAIVYPGWAATSGPTPRDAGGA